MSKIQYYLAILLIFISTLVNAQTSSLPAFPGAEGFGATTVGGRGGEIIKVTNLHDSGPGSLRAALEAEGPRIVVFTTGGIIDLETKLYIRSPHVTIAGQTAPGDGICIRGNGLSVQTHDVVLRYLRIRPGDINFGPKNQWGSLDALSLGSENGESVYNVMIDHCSFSWAVDENVGIWGNCHDVTLQYCIISEALRHSKHPKGSHSMGVLIGGKATRIAIHHNIFAHNNDRNPYINGHSLIDFRNNVIYNPGGTATDITVKKGQAINYINNYIIPGPDTKIEVEVSVRNLQEATPHLYFDGNVSATANFRIAYYQDNTTTSLPYRTLPDIFKHSEASAAPVITTYTAEHALEYALLEAGAILPNQDAVDKKIIQDILSRKGGIVNTKRTLLSWPPYNPGVAPTDTDEDGMPDYWEESYGLNTSFDNSNNDTGEDGYTDIEEYINRTSSLFSNDDLSNARVQGSNSFQSNFKNHHLKFEMIQNFPNPVTDLTNVGFSLDRSSQVLIKVFNVHGQEVSELVNSFLYEGKYQIVWDASSLREGIYHLLISSENSIRSIKAVVSR